MWQTMETAPKDGTAIQADIPGNGADNIIAWLPGWVDDNDRSCGGWVFLEDQEPPACWSDGVCWEKNSEGEKSVQPTRWKPLE